MNRLGSLAAIVLFLIAGPAHAQSLAPALRVDPITRDQGQTFVITGAVIGFDYLHVWGFPDSGPVFLGAMMADKIDRALQRPTGGFELLVTNAPTGTYPIVVYAHSPTTNDFPLQWGQMFTVHTCASMRFPVRWVMRAPSLGVSAYGWQFHTVCIPDRLQ